MNNDYTHYEPTVNPTNGRREWLHNGQICCPRCGKPWPDATTTVCPTCSEHQRKQAEARVYARAAAQTVSTELVSIRRTQVKNGFRFEGTFSNGAVRVLRTTATRPYTLAAIHDSGVVLKFNNDDPRRFITFHSKAPKPMGHWDRIIRTLPIEG